MRWRWSRRGDFGQQPLVEVDAALDGAIADRVDADLERGGVRRAHAREDLVVVEGQEAALAGAVAERLVHARRAAAEGAVGEDLETADAASGGGIVERRRAQRDRRVDAAPDQDRVGRERHLVEQQLQRDRFETARGAGGSLRVGLEHHARRGDAERREPREGRARAVAQPLERGRRRRPEQALRGGLEAGAERAPVGGALDAAAGRIGRARVDAGRRERQRVAHGAVSVVLDDQRRAIGARGVEFGARREPPLGEVLVLQLETDQPLARGQADAARLRSTSCSAAMLRTLRAGPRSGRSRRA